LKRYELLKINNLNQVQAEQNKNHGFMGSIIFWQFMLWFFTAAYNVCGVPQAVISWKVLLGCVKIYTELKKSSDRHEQPQKP
jgi:hypothetical protein